MRASFIVAVLAVGLAGCSFPAAAQSPASLAETSLNAMCPIGKEPTVPSAGTVEYKGNTIGLCCPGCGKQFLAWDENRKDEFVALAVAHREPGRVENSGASPAAPGGTGGGSGGPTYPYTLPDCPIGGALGSMGDPIVKVYDNREVRFCCAGCIGTFEKNPAKHWAEIDKRMIDQQLMHYPIETCIVTGGKLGENAVDHIHNNRLVRLANGATLAAFKADPGTHLAAFDKRIIETQRRGYPLDACPVGGPLGSMGDPIDFLYMNRLVRLCCGRCEASLVTDPAAFMATLDKAYADAQRGAYPIGTCVVAGSELGSMGEPVEIVAGTRLVRFCCDSCLPGFRADPAAYLSKLPRE